MTNWLHGRILNAALPLLFIAPLPTRPHVRYDDPILETIARSIHTFFPRCVKCGEPVESYDDADVRIHTKRVVHRMGCPPTSIVRQPS